VCPEPACAWLGGGVVVEYSLPFGRWGHVHLESGYAFADNLNVMSRQMTSATVSGSTVTMAGRLAEMYYWSNVLEPADVAVIAQGFDQTLRCGPRNSCEAGPCLTHNAANIQNVLAE
jgi:hypothetical protein